MQTRGRRTHQIPSWMADYYHNSVGGAVLESYRIGRVVTVDADETARTNRHAAELRAAEAELAALTAEVDAQYWTFTRTARGRPVDPALCRRQADARARVMNLRNA